MQIMIKVFQHSGTSMMDLPADVDKQGNVIKIYDYQMNELKVNSDGTISYNGKRWTFNNKQNIN
ncbi:hypothetical protein MW354_000342 [Acinetobacter baumannii]|nr:hypothetical protein [Acinetobacter baumannii]EJB8474909.1 hypothetical protein [Acinetobacter baumannii]EJB8549543.1 hypothetical protein [Acinetobacter baumannii]EJB8566695.1 hypothetical protein [Acinetobacter baumannii]